MPVGNCLAGCIVDYKCGTLRVPDGNAAPDGDVMAPFVVAKFKGSGGETTITVGNESAPDFDHHAVITSFEYGASDGLEGSLEIIDEQGGAFNEFVDAIVKCLNKENDPNSTVLMSWGWIAQNCRGGLQKFGGDFTAKMKLQGLEVTFAEGKVKYNINLLDLGQLVFTSKEDDIWGTDKAKMPLKQAIRRLGVKRAPTMKFRFFRKGVGGRRDSTWNFKDFPKPDGPVCVWDTDNENKLNTIMKWIEPFQTDKGKGVFITASTSEADTFILWEDTKPKPGEAESCVASQSIGTFLVNAGRCSNVLEFSPKISWPQAFARLATGGGTEGAGGSGSQKQKKDEGSKDQGEQTGSQEGLTMNRYAWDCHGPKNAIKKLEESQKLHHRAGAGAMGIESIEAELKLVGIPFAEFVKLVLIKGRWASIVVINPFHIFGTTNGGCGEWLAKPGCNKILSNKKWLVLGVNHQISAGQYTTTLKVKLPVPGIDLLPNEPLGGFNSEGAVVANTC